MYIVYDIFYMLFIHTTCTIYYIPYPLHTLYTLLCTLLYTLHYRHVPYSAMVKRDNTWSVIDSALLVPGDLILLEGPGTIVPADCRINPTGGINPGTIDPKNISSGTNPGTIIPCKFNQSSLTNDSMNLVTLYPYDSVKMMSILVEGSNVECTVEFTGYDTYIGKMIAIVKVCVLVLCVLVCIGVCW